jgi:hypothetical protein
MTKPSRRARGILPPAFSFMLPPIRFDYSILQVNDKTLNRMALSVAPIKLRITYFFPLSLGSRVQARLLLLVHLEKCGLRRPLFAM